MDLPPVTEWRRRASDEHARVEREVIKLERVARGAMCADARRGEGAVARLLRLALGGAL